MTAGRLKIWNDLAGEWEYVNSPPGPVSEITSDDNTITITNPSGPTVDLSAGGGSQPGGMTTADFLFTEEATGGVYTATMDIDAGTTVADVKLIPLATWQADSVTFGMGDTLGGPSSYFDPTSKDLQSICANPYDPTAPASDDNFASLASDGDIYGGNNSPGNQPIIWADSPSMPPGIYYVASDTITMTADTTGASNLPVSPTGQLLVRVYFHTAAAQTNADFAAAP